MSNLTPIEHLYQGVSSTTTWGLVGFLGTRLVNHFTKSEYLSVGGVTALIALHPALIKILDVVAKSSVNDESTVKDLIILTASAAGPMLLVNRMMRVNIDYKSSLAEIVAAYALVTLGTGVIAAIRYGIGKALSSDRKDVTLLNNFNNILWWTMPFNIKL